MVEYKSFFYNDRDDDSSTLSACLLIIELLGSLTAITPMKHKLDEFFAYSQCIYDNQVQALITVRVLKQDGFKLGTSSFDSQFTS